MSLPLEPLPAVALMLVGGVACQALSRRLHVPAIVPLLLVGMGLGALGILDPDAGFGDGRRVIVGLAVAIILFEGGLSLKSESFRFAGKAIRRLCSVGALVTWIACAALSYFLFPDLEIEASVLFGALVIVTGPTVVLPLLKVVNPRQRVADVLRGEAILVDPVGALLAVLAYDYLTTDGVLQGFAVRVGIGAGIGLAGAWMLDRLLRYQHELAPDLKNRTVLVAAIALYALAEGVKEESGVLAVTLAGFGLGWLHPPGVEDIEEFKGHVVGLMVSLVFILLAADVHPQALADLGLPGLFVVLGVIFLVRPASVFVSTVGTDLSLREKAFLSWIAPRGIVAASVSSLFALHLDTPYGFLVRDLTFAVIVGTVLVQGPTARPVGRWLGVLAGAPTGFLIVGGSRTGIMLGRALLHADHRVLLLDTNYAAVRRAREAGIPARRTNALDDTAMESLDLDGLGWVMAVTPNDAVNRLAVRLYGSTFGTPRVRAIRTTDSPARDDVPALAPWLFAERRSLEELEGELGSGSTVEMAAIDENTTVDEIQSGGEMIPLIAFDRSGVPRFLDEGAALEIGESVMYLDPHLETGVATVAS